MWTAVGLVALVLAGEGPSTRAAGEVRATVDPRVELLSIVFRLAGNPEYNTADANVPYVRAVDEHFAGFKDHAAVQMARSLRAGRGVSYDAVMSFAIHLTSVDDLKERTPLDARDTLLERRWDATNARAFITQLRDFVDDTAFLKFMSRHEALHRRAAERMTQHLATLPLRGWFDEFFGAKPEADFTVVVGLLIGGNNYGVSVRERDGREVISPVIGAWRWNADGEPEFGDAYDSTIVHEFCHAYVNPLVDAHAEQLRRPGEVIYPVVESVMKNQAYSNWKTMMYESLVRASVVRYMAANRSPEAALQQIAYERLRGFHWTEALSDELERYERQRKEFPTLASYMPQIVTFFNDYALRFVTAAEKQPKVVSISPADGATDVDPATTKIIVTFDRPMKDQSWSVTGGGPSFPKIAGKPSYDAARKILTLPVTLEPGTKYQFGLNGGGFSGFQSEDGTPLEPVVVTFTTRR